MWKEKNDNEQGEKDNEIEIEEIPIKNIIVEETVPANEKKRTNLIELENLL